MITLNEFEDRVIEGEPPKFKIGDSVSTKTIGLPGVGTIIGIMPGYYYNVAFYGANIQDVWLPQFPLCLYKPVYLVAFSEPRKSTSWEEFASSVKHIYNEAYLREQYKELTEFKILWHPEDNLEAF